MTLLNVGLEGKQQNGQGRDFATALCRPLADDKSVVFPLPPRCTLQQQTHKKGQSKGLLQVVPDHSAILTCLSRDSPPYHPTSAQLDALIVTRGTGDTRRGGTDEVGAHGLDDAAVIYGRDALKIHGFLIWCRRPA